MVYAQELFNIHRNVDDESQYRNDVQEESSSNSFSNSSEVFWSEAETLLLISLYDDHKEDFFHAKKRKHVWAIIQEKMAAHNYFVS